MAANQARKSGPQMMDLEDKKVDDTTVTRLSWQECNAPVIGLRINNGGHTWPSGYQYLKKEKVGAVTQEISMDDIWNFLSSKRLANNPPRPMSTGE